jgi:hypothetical protein
MLRIVMYRFLIQPGFEISQIILERLAKTPSAAANLLLVSIHAMSAA